MKLSTKTPESQKSATSAGLLQRIDYFYSLIEASKVINSTLDLDELLEAILQIALKNTNAVAGTIYLKDESNKEIWSKITVSDQKVEIRLPLGHGIAGQVALNGETINLQTAQSHPKFDGTFDKKTGFITQSMLCMPLKNDDGQIIGVFQIMNSSRGGFSSYDEEFLAGLSEHAAIALEKAALHRSALENEALRQEMQMARKIQMGLLPKEVPFLNEYQISGRTIPAQFVGGDYFDYILTKQNVLRFCVADVCGKGVPAALLMATLRSAIHFFDPAFSATAISEFAAHLNRLICESSPASSFITMYYGELDTTSGKLLYLNCGHNQPILLRANGEISSVAGHSPALALMPVADFSVCQTDLRPGDSLFIYTDGVTEAMNEKKEEFGENRLQQLLYDLRQNECQQLITQVTQSVRQFIGNESQRDDITLLYLTRSDSSYKR